MTSYKKVALGISALALAMASAASAASTVVQGFEGASLAQNITVGGGFIPPDTMGAVGTTQYVSILNGSFSVYNKATGTQTAFIDDDAFWSAAGATGVVAGATTSFTGGDPRVLFDATRNRWIATAFGGDRSFLNIAVSDTADALGPWKATTFLGFNGVAGAGVADYATLAMDRNAVYIGTNDFDTAGFIGTTLNVIPIGDVFGAAAPVVTNRAIFTQAFAGVSAATDKGFAIQGVNSNSAGTTGKVVADGLATNGVGYDITNAGTATAARGATTVLGVQNFNANLDARQPDGSRTLDMLDTRISGSAWEQNGKIYFVRTVTPDTGPNVDYGVARITVLNATDFSVVQEIDIGGGQYDYYQPSLAISAAGVVVGYNRSGFQAATGNVAFMANAYTLDANGLLVFDAQHMLKYSENPGYSLVGGGRNRWGDYSAVNVDPTDSTKFWAIGEFANFRAGGADGWSTWIGVVQFGQVNAAVPEPATWAQMLVGFGLIGGAIRRKRVTNVTYSVA
jgi:PEP-CTERM motif